MQQDLQPMLEYFHPPVPAIEVRFTLGRVLALGYVAICILCLLLMGTIMALQV